VFSQLVHDLCMLDVRDHFAVKFKNIERERERERETKSK
jgi:hypothetical protein